MGSVCRCWVKAQTSPDTSQQHNNMRIAVAISIACLVAVAAAQADDKKPAEKTAADKKPEEKKAAADGDNVNTRGLLGGLGGLLGGRPHHGRPHHNRPVHGGGFGGGFGHGGRPGGFGGQGGFGHGGFGGQGGFGHGGRPGGFGGHGGFGGNQGGPATCRRWCKTPEGQDYCCEHNTDPIKHPVTALVTKPGYCPQVRAECVIRGQFGPQTCSSDGGCHGNDRCCYDRCLQRHVCKQPLGHPPATLG